MQPILIHGRWQDAAARSTFQAHNPGSGEALPDVYPVSDWSDCEQALDAAAAAFMALRECPPLRIAGFLESFAERIEARAGELVAAAHSETALPETPRLKDVELPRTTNQLRLAAAAARDGTWRRPIIDAEANIRSHLAALGPVAVFGPNNFPFAFNSIAGGDFAAAIAAGNPVIAKANSSHPATTRLLAEEAHQAALAAELPAGTVQLLYRLDHEDGLRLVADHRLAATGYTGSREAGLKLKAAAEAAGNLIYLELSSINSVVVLPGALRERRAAIAEEFTTSCLMGTGQFCTNPGLVVLIEGPESELFIDDVAAHFRAAASGTLLSAGVRDSLIHAIETLRDAGAELVCGGDALNENRFACTNTLLRVAGEQFLARTAELQTEAFGNASLFVVAGNLDVAERVLEHLEGNLTGCIYSHTGGEDDVAYDRLAPPLRQRVGRLLNDKMPTGVAVSPAMNHGGPYPATGHPHFTAVGMPTAIERFTALHCYDGVRAHRLPVDLR